MFETTQRPQRPPRRRARGFATVEQVLAIAAVLGCFLYPLSLAIRTAGRALVDQMERAERTLLTEP